MAWQFRRKETASTYFTRRAREERTSAVDAGSAEARSAHLELALRLSKIAIEPAAWGEWLSAAAERAAAPGGEAQVGRVLRGAFPLPSNAGFGELLEAVDSSASRD